MLNITNSQKSRAVDCRFRRVKKVSNCNQAAQRFYNLLSAKEYSLHDTQGVADSSSATPTIWKVASSNTCGLCFHISRQTQYPRGLRGYDAAQRQYLSHLRRNARSHKNRPNWRFVGVFFNNSPTKIQQDFEADFRSVFRFFNVPKWTYFWFAPIETV